MSDAPLTTPAYTILRHAALATLEAGKIRAQQAVEQEKIRTGWEIGKMLHQHLLKNKDRAEYGERVITQPADDLEMGPQRLYEMLAFHRTFPIFRSSGKFNLSWTHYVKLLKLLSSETRDYHIEQAEEKGWSVRDLQQAIREKTHEKTLPPAGTTQLEPVSPKPVLTPRRVRRLPLRFRFLNVI